jgi:hypothetical protein
LNDKTSAAARAAANITERATPPKPVPRSWKPDPCLLTRREIKALIAENIG